MCKVQLITTEISYLKTNRMDWCKHWAHCEICLWKCLNRSSIYWLYIFYKSGFSLV